MDDTTLKKALLLAAAQDYDQQLRHPSDVTFSRRFQRRMNKLLQDPFKNSKPAYFRILKAVACVVLVIAFVSAILWQVPGVKAYVQRLIVEHFPTYDKFDIVERDSDEELGLWLPEYLPEGYELDSVENLDGLIYQLYSRDDCIDLFIEYQIMDSGKFIIDNEHQTVGYTTLNNHSATVYIASSQEWCSYVIWTDDECNILFKVFGYLKSDELIKIAESLEKVRASE